MTNKAKKEYLKDRQKKDFWRSRRIIKEKKIRILSILLFIIGYLFFFPPSTIMYEYTCVYQNPTYPNSIVETPHPSLRILWGPIYKFVFEGKSLVFSPPSNDEDEGGFGYGGGLNPYEDFSQLTEIKLEQSGDKYFLALEEKTTSENFGWITPSCKSKLVDIFTYYKQDHKIVIQ